MPDLSSTLKISVATVGPDGLNQSIDDAEVALVQATDVIDMWPYSNLDVTNKYEAATSGYTNYVGTEDKKPQAGEWLLVVRKAPFTPVVQRLTLSNFTWKDKDGQHQSLRAAPGWASKHESGRRACLISVEITNAGVASKAVPVPQITTIKTLLLPRSDFVGFACHNHLDGTNYLAFTETRLAVLYMRGTGKNADKTQGAKLGKGAVGTIFHADKRTTRVLLKSADPTPSSWVTVYEDVKAPIDADAGKNRPYATVDHELGILDFYLWLNSLSQQAPGTCVEAGIFGHSWVNGPILWNTADNSNVTTQRAPDDLDGRTKDWLENGKSAMTATGPVSVGPTTSAISNMAKAFASGQDFKGRLRIWGCSHMRRILSEMNAGWNQLKLVDKGASTRSTVFTFDLRDLATDNGASQMIGWESATLDHLKMNIHGYALSRYFARTEEDGDARRAVNYLGAAAQYLRSRGVLVFGAPPGMGSLYRGVAGTGNQPAAAFFIKVDGGENYLAHQYLKREFGSYYKEDEEGLAYLEYTQLLGVPSSELADPGWNTQRSMAFYDTDRDSAVLRLPSETEVLMPIKDPTKNPETQINVNVHPKKAFLSPSAYNNDGHLYVMPHSLPDRVEVRGPRQVLILKTDSTADTAIWVRTNGTVTLLTRPNRSTPFAPPLIAVSRTIAAYQGQSYWVDTQTAASPATVANGMLETASPRYYW